jgi:hypothetical protein
VTTDDNQDRSIMTARRRRRSGVATRLLSLGAVMVASAGLAYGGTAALAGHVTQARVRPLANVFSVLRRAHISDDASAPREPIGGATSTVFAARFPTGDSVYVATLDTGDVCLVDQQPAGPAGSAPTAATGLTAVACAHPAQAESSGVSIVTAATAASPARITVLVPNGVQSVSFAETDGTTITQSPAGNVAQYAATNLAAANFVAPDGQGVSEPVPTSTGASSN